MLRFEDLQAIKERAASGLQKGRFRAKINFHMGSCGIAAGAKKLNALVLQKMEENGIQDIQVIHSGCAGLCSREPMVTIESPGLPSVKYCDLNEKKIEEIFDRHILNGEVVDAYAFAIEDGEEAPPSDKTPRLQEIVALVREKLGPVAAFKLAITVGRLPKTRSGKILRGTIKKIADGDQWAMPATIEDPKVLDEIGDALKGRV